MNICIECRRLIRVWFIYAVVFYVLGFNHNITPALFFMLISFTIFASLGVFQCVGLFLFAVQGRVSPSHLSVFRFSVAVDYPCPVGQSWCRTFVACTSIGPTFAIVRGLPSCAIAGVVSEQYIAPTTNESLFMFILIRV